MIKYISNILLLLWSTFMFAQQNLTGIIMKDTLQSKLGLEGANVYWLHTNIGAITNNKGRFKIPYKLKNKKLVISFVGYKTDTIEVVNSKPIYHYLRESKGLEEITITSAKKDSYKSYLTTENVLTVNSGELLKAACCNLSESFETNPSIDVNFSDAITGTKQIQMLGLTSPYLLITQENIPSIRGASQAFGLSFIPGTWIESIQITKGAGSVVNGYESISGHINTELIKPSSDKKFFINVYSALGGRLELNSHINNKISDKWYTGFYIHGNNRMFKHDTNKDGFLDMPLGSQINIMNRWQFIDSKKGWVSFINFNYLKDDKQLGEVDFNPQIDKKIKSKWGGEVNTNKFQTAFKLGYVFPNLPYQSLGFQAAYNSHKQNSYFGLRDYDINHQSLYSNLLFNSIIGSTQHKFKTGLTITYDLFDENVENLNFNRVEKSVGTFFEYAYDNLENFSYTAGLRLDFHNLLGIFITPRLHVRYVPWRKSVIRASLGSGRRSTTIFTENQQLFSSARKINIKNSDGKIYGLNPEKAWNYGVSFMQGYTLFTKKGDVTIDFYQTNFTNQVVVDWEKEQEIGFYNLTGKSIANSFQVEVNQNIFNTLESKFAYKFHHVITNYSTGELQKPLQPKHRFFINSSYKTPKKNNGRQLKMDFTYNWIGKQRLPKGNSEISYSNSYHLLNTQITSVFSKQFEVYIGCENLTNYKQKNVIKSSNNPFEETFDSTIIYAPIFGRNYYAGLRLKFN